MGACRWFFWAYTTILIVVPLSQAGIILSGDANIGNPLDGSAGAPVDAGNKRFFLNVLAGGHKVVIHGDLDPGATGGSIGAVPAAMNGYYNSLSGVTSSIFSGVITPAVLAGADLFIVVLPNDAYTPSELSAMNSFAAAGKNIFFLGDNASFGTPNARINAALASLGTSMSILNTIFDTGFHTATTGPQIVPDSYTAGVTTFTYAAPSAIAGGSPLFFGTGGERFVAYVPEPSALLAGLGGVVLLRRLRRA